MSIATDHTHETRYYSRIVTLDDGPIEAIPVGHYSHKGKSYQVTSLSARWDHGKQPEDIKVSGLLLKANGEVGAAGVTLNYTLKGDSFWRPEAPQWIRDIFTPTETSN